MRPLSVTVSDKAGELFDEYKKRRGLNQNDALDEILLMLGEAKEGK